MAYTVEIELPGSKKWFGYASGIESREEAENINGAAKGRLKARVRKKLTGGCEINAKKLF